MKVALISTSTHPMALGLRYVSSSLKAGGHEIRMILMSGRKDTARVNFPPAMVEDLVGLVRSCDLVGMSLLTNNFHRASFLTKVLRDRGVQSPIVWGGTHPSVAPEESLTIADIVCIGEGEGPMRALADALEHGRDPTEIGSLWFRRNGRTIRNPPRSLEAQLDALPRPDYDLSTQWAGEKGRLVQARPELLRGSVERYRILSTRGCPYRCTFCNNTVQLQAYQGKGQWVRKRSNENVIAEIEAMRSQFPAIEAINIVDDLFFVRTEAEIEAFARLYRDRVNLPLEIDAHPNTITRAKVHSLRQVPIRLISMGIQSGSAKTLYEIYERRTPIKRIVEAINLFADYRMRAEYHYIINNPYEPDDNVVETLYFAARHHRGPFIVRVFPLMFYPGSPLYDRARADGLIGPRHEDAYEHLYRGKLKGKGQLYLAIWLRVVLWLRGHGVPRVLVRGLAGVVTNRHVRWFADRRWFPAVSYGVYRVWRGFWKKLVYQPFVRPLRHVRRKRRYAGIPYHF